MLLGVDADHERRDVDKLLADTNMTLLDQNTGMMDRLSEAELDDLGLEAALEEILDLEGEYVIEGLASLVEKTETGQTTQERGTLKDAAGVLLIEREQFACGGADL